VSLVKTLFIKKKQKQLNLGSKPDIEDSVILEQLD
jgi:hypothetical protein